MLEDYGKFNHRPMPLDPLLDNLRATLDKNPNDAWTFKLYRETAWLHLAETCKDLRGWQWSTNLYRMSMIRKFQQAQMLLDPLVQQQDHPLYERALWLRGRISFHLDREYEHEPDRVQAQKDFQTLLQRHHSDTLLQMYSGAFFPNEQEDIELHPSAPAWSKQQALALHRLRKLVHYWVLERQAPNGEMGGKYGDDVEALRFWYPLFYLGDSIATLGLKRLADGVWNSNQVANGFSKNIDDVEHSSEFISDTAPAMIAAFDEAGIHDRALPTARYFTDLWTQRGADDQLFFKSSWYSSSAIDERPPRNRDVPMNTRTTKVLRYYLWRYPDDARIRNMLYDWTKSWAKLARGTAKGKPEGILPVSYRASDGALNGDEPNWYQANMFWPYYDFRGDAMMLDQMLFLWQHVDDDELLYPVEATIGLVDKYREKGGAPGSPQWAAAKYISNRGFHSLAGQWRLITGKTDYDQMLMKYGAPYLKYRINGDLPALVQALRKFNEDLGYNWKMVTSDTWFTDRIWAPGPHASGRVNADVLKAMLTGDMNRNGTSPYMAVTWEGVSPGFTALVEGASDTGIRISAFNHAPGKQQISLRLWNLSPGQYDLFLEGKKRQSLELKKAGQRVPLEIASGQLMNVEIQKK